MNVDIWRFEGCSSLFAATEEKSFKSKHVMLDLREYDDYVLTHLLTPVGPVPSAFDPDGVYPYMSFCETSHRPVPKKYRFVSMENEHLSVTICPDLGGKVYSMVHKPS